MQPEYLYCIFPAFFNDILEGNAVKSMDNPCNAANPAGFIAVFHRLADLEILRFHRRREVLAAEDWR